MYILISLLIIFFLFKLANRSTSKNPREMTLEVLTKTVESFLNNQDRPYDWDDFLTFPISDSKMNAFRIECIKIDDLTEPGKEKIRKLLENLIEEFSKTNK